MIRRADRLLKEQKDVIGGALRAVDALIDIREKHFGKNGINTPYFTYTSLIGRTKNESLSIIHKKDAVYEIIDGVAARLTASEIEAPKREIAQKLISLAHDTLVSYSAEQKKALKDLQQELAQLSPVESPPAQPAPPPADAPRRPRFFFNRERWMREDPAGFDIMRTKHKNEEKRAVYIRRRMDRLGLTIDDVVAHLNNGGNGHSQEKPQYGYNTVQTWRHRIGQESYAMLSAELGIGPSGRPNKKTPEWITEILEQREAERQSQTAIRNEQNAQKGHIRDLIRKIYRSRGKKAPKSDFSIAPDAMAKHARDTGFSTAEAMLEEARDLQLFETKQLGVKVKMFAVACRVLCKNWDTQNLQAWSDAMPDEESRLRPLSLAALTNPFDSYGGVIDPNQLSTKREMNNFPTQRTLLNLIAGIYRLDAENGHNLLQDKPAVARIANMMQSGEPLPVFNQQLKLLVSRALDDVIVAAESQDIEFRSRRWKTLRPDGR